MNKSDYIRMLGGSENIIVKIPRLESLASTLCPETVEEFFISEYKKTNGQRILENMWFFSPTFILESKNIIQENINLDILCINKIIDRIEIDSEKYDFTKATDESSLTIILHMTTAVALLKSTGFNCDKLWGIVQEYFIPNIYKGD